jgi:hypothetical protein
MNDIYLLKSNSESSVNRNINKHRLLLNSLIGRFGMKLNKDITKIVDNKTFNNIATTNVIKSFYSILDMYSVT